MHSSSSNTPSDKSADLNHIEYLWKKRFRLISTPSEKIQKYLENKNDWLSSPVFEDIKFYKYAPEFTVKSEMDEHSNAYKYYMFLQVDFSPLWYNIEIRLDIIKL